MIFAHTIHTNTNIDLPASLHHLYHHITHTPISTISPIPPISHSLELVKLALELGSQPLVDVATQSVVVQLGHETAGTVRMMGDDGDSGNLHIKKEGCGCRDD